LLRVLPPLPEYKWSDRVPHGPVLRRHEEEVLAFLKARLKSEGRRAARRESEEPDS
jgi:hypothetical protein